MSGRVHAVYLHNSHVARMTLIYKVHTIGFQTFFVWAFKVIVDSEKFTMLLLYILWDDRPIFMISGSNKQLQQQLEYTLLKSDCHSWWISKMQSGREDTLEERYAIKFCFELGKNATETYGMLQIAFGASCMNRVSVFEWHKRFKEGRESVSFIHIHHFLLIYHPTTIVFSSIWTLFCTRKLSVPKEK